MYVNKDIKVLVYNENKAKTYNKNECNYNIIILAIFIVKISVEDNMWFSTGNDVCITYNDLSYTLILDNYEKVDDGVLITFKEIRWKAV